MHCPECGYRNQDGSKYCGGCGQKLWLICRQCNSGNNPDNKYCNECGRALKPLPMRGADDLSFDEKLEKIQKYLPQGLTEKILARRDRIEGERKQVTVMFCDMQGFTLLSEKLDPEVTYAIMDRVYEILIHKVHDYGGTVNEMTGDGIMALFGAPIALEDAPQRAVRSSLAIHRELAKFNDRMKKERGKLPRIKMRIGIHTGPVVVGTMGNDLRVEFKAVGDTVNTASRMEGLAEPGATYITEATFQHTRGLFHFEALGKKYIKGKSEPMPTYRVIAPSHRRTRFDVSVHRGLTPFVGRNREIELLLEGLERAKTGRGQAFSIIAEAGIGKSRLVYEFIKTVANENVTILEGKCLSYGRNAAYGPVADILKSNFDVIEDDSDAAIRCKVQEGLKVLKADEAKTLPYLLELLSVKDSGLGQIPMSTEGKKDRILEALKHTVINGSEIRPLVMVIEDLHWIDRSTEDSLKDLLANISGARVLLLFTYRPEYVHTWGGRSYHSQITLNRLSNRDTLSMVNHLLGTDDIDERILDLVLEKSEGVPFFVEELVKSLNELGGIVKSDNRYQLSADISGMSIPATIHEVIMARIDSLPEGAKEVLKAGAAIEREFSHPLIRETTLMPEEDLLTFLSILKDAEVLLERGIYPETTYTFKHAFTREVVYDSILGNQKQALHQRIGEAFESLHDGKIDENYAVLAEHFIAGRDYKKGAQYSKLAARRAVKSASLSDAIRLGKKRIASLERLPQTHDTKLNLIDAHTNLGLCYLQLTYPVKAYESVAPIFDLALKSNHEKRLSQIYTIIGTYYFTNQGDLSSGIEFLKKALHIAEKNHHLASLWMVHHWIGHALADNCEFHRALQHLQKALAISEGAQVTWSISIMKSCIANTVYNNQGNGRLGYELSREGIQLAEAIGDVHSKAEAYVNNGIARYLNGFLDEAESTLTKGAGYSSRMDLVQSSLADYFLGLIEIARENFKSAKLHLSHAIGCIEPRQYYPEFINLLKIISAYVDIKSQQKEIDLQGLIGLVRGNRIKLYQGQMYFWLSKIAGSFEGRGLQRASEWIKQAISSHRRHDLLWHLGMDYVWVCEIFTRQKDRTHAKKSLEKAIGFFNRCGADGWVKKYRKELVLLD